MMRRLAPMLAIATGLALPIRAEAAEARAARPAMGTVLQIVVEADDLATATALAERAMSLAHRWDDVLTTWRPEGELARLNAQAGRGPFAASSELRAALKRMQPLVTATDSAFNPTAGPLVAHWRSGAPGTASALDPAPDLAAVLRVAADGVRLAAGASLEAGAIGKGIALDAIARVLRAGGASSLWLDFGGSSQLGWSQGRRPRRLAVAGLGEGVVHGTVDVLDVAVSTSRATGPGAEVGPIVDPRTGDVVRAARVVTVLAAEAATADAWSTALIVLGRDGVDKARAAGCEVFYEDEEGTVETPGFRSGKISVR